MCSPVLTGHCLLLATPGDGWGVERGFDAQIGFRARFDQSESSTPAQATNERPAAFLRGNLGGERGSGEVTPFLSFSTADGRWFVRLCNRPLFYLDCITVKGNL